MILFQTLFASAIPTDQQKEFLNFLGLAQERFRFVEVLPTGILRSVEFQEGTISGLEEPTESNQLEAWIAESPLPVVVRKYAAPFSVPEKVTEKTLAQWLLPYPWSVLLAPPEDFEALRIEPESFRKKVEKWRVVFFQLEARLSEAELGCILLDEEAQSRAFLCHSIRGKVMRASFFPAFSLNDQRTYLQQTSCSVIDREAFRALQNLEL